MYSELSLYQSNHHCINEWDKEIALKKVTEVTFPSSLIISFLGFLSWQCPYYWMPKVQRIWQTAAAVWLPPLVCRRYVVGYIGYVLPTCLNQGTLFIPCNAETLTQNCSWSCKEHHQLEGQPSEQLYWATRQDFTKKGTKKGSKHSRLFDSIYQKWSFPVGLQISLTSGLYYSAKGKHLKYL